MRANSAARRLVGPATRTAVLLGLLLAGRPLAAQDVLFQDAFADLANWGAPAGWSVAAGELTAAGGNISLCRTGQDWTNVAVEFEVTIRKTLAQWVIRAADPDTCCFIQLTSTDCPYSPNSLRCHTWRNGKLGEIREDALPIEIKAGQAYRIRCEVVGTTAQTLIDGRVRGRWDFGTGYARGTIGVRASEKEVASFRNLRVVRCDTLTPLAQARKSKPRPAPPTDPFLRPAYRAEWVWGPGDALDRGFRFNLEAPARAVDARLWITCDNAFRLYLNGEQLATGDSWQTPQLVDLAPRLVVGSNVLAVFGHNLEPGAAGVLAEGNVLLADGTNVAIVSSPAWRTSTELPEGWQTPGFAATGWTPAVSQGRHPQAPWAGQVDWVLPYVGPLETAAELTATVGAPAAGRDALDVVVRIRNGRPLAVAHPVRVLVALPGMGEVVAAEGYPAADAGGGGATGDREWRQHLPLVPGLWLPDGTFGARVELVGVKPASDDAGRRSTLAWSRPPRPAPLPLSKRPMAPGLFTDTLGGAHRYRLDADWLVYDDQRLLPLAHGDGAYWCTDDEPLRPAIEAARGTAVLDRVRRHGLTEEPVRLRLFDHIVCADPASEAAHEFSEDDGYGGRSRLLAVGDVTYRVTDNRRKLSYFAYTLRCRRPGEPHLLVFETPNDRERYTLVRVQPPWRNIGCGPYTGRDMACNGLPYQAGFVFYPEAEEVRLTVSRLPCEERIDPESGGAVSRLWLFEFADALGERPAEIAPTPGPARRVGLALTHPGYLYELYGRRGDTPVQRLASLTAFADYAQFAGLNLLEFNAVNGADTSETAYYPSAIWNRFRADANLLAEWLPIAAARGFAVVPCLTSLALDIDRFAGAEWISPLTFQIDKDGHSRRDFFANRGNDNTLPDPLRPEVQKVFLDTLAEIAEQAKGSPAVTGIAFRLNGKIGTCYVGYDEQATADTTGFSPWDLAEFQRDSGVRIPGWEDSLVERWVAAIRAKRHDDPAVRFIPQAHDWLRANAWPAWTDWRCRRFAALVLEARNRVRAVRPDWNLVVKCDMPSETPDRNILWPAGRAPLELFRDHGFDPRLFATEPGVVLQQGYFIGGGEYFHHAGGGAYYQNPRAWGAFDYQPGLAELYRTPAGTSVEFYHNYWEEFGVARMGEFGTDFWGAGTMFPAGRWFFRPLLHALRANQVGSMALFSWERGSAGHEGELRRFSRAFRALPVVAPVPFSGKVEVQSGPAADESLWLCRFGERLAVVNESPEPRVLRLTLACPAAGQALYEYASQRRLGQPAAAPGPVAADLELDPFDLRVLGFE